MVAADRLYLAYTYCAYAYAYAGQVNIGTSSVYLLLRFDMAHVYYLCTLPMKLAACLFSEIDPSTNFKNS
jgi:hypothetical protein